MEQAICDYVKTCSEPDFFHHPDDPALRQVHEDIKRSIEEATETITINMDLRLIHRAEKVLESVSKSIPTRIMQEVYGYRPNGQKPRSGQRVCHSG